MNNSEFLDQSQKEFVINEFNLETSNNVKEEFNHNIELIEKSIKEIKCIEGDENFTIEDFDCLDKYFLSINNLMQILDISFPKIIKLNTKVFTENIELKNKLYNYNSEEIFKRDDEMEYLLSLITKNEEIIKIKEEVIQDKSIHISNIEKNNSYLIDEIEKKADSIFQLKEIIKVQSKKIVRNKDLQILINKLNEVKNDCKKLKNEVTSQKIFDFVKNIEFSPKKKSQHNFDLLQNKLKHLLNNYKETLTQRRESFSPQKKESPSFSDKILFKSLSSKEFSKEKTSNLNELLKVVDSTLISYKNLKENHFFLCKLLRNITDNNESNIEYNFINHFYKTLLNNLRDNFEITEKYNEILLSLYEKIELSINENTSSNKDSLDELNFHDFFKKQIEFQRPHAVSLEEKRFLNEFNKIKMNDSNDLSKKI